MYIGRSEALGCVDIIEFLIYPCMYTGSGLTLIAVSSRLLITVTQKPKTNAELISGFESVNPVKSWHRSFAKDERTSRLYSIEASHLSKSVTNELNDCNSKKKTHDNR